MTAVVGSGSYAELDFTNHTHAVEQIYLTIEGADANAFGVADRMVYLGSGNALDSIATRGIAVNFSPISYKIHHAILIATDSNGTKDTVALTGNGIGAGIYAYIGGQNDSVPVGKSECNDVVIMNADAKIPITITSLSLGTTDADDWTTKYITIDYSNITLPVTVNPKDSIKFRWCFTPLVKRFFYADSLIVKFTSITGIDQTSPVYLYGRSERATAPDSECVHIIGSSRDTLQFQTVSAGSTTGADVTFVNPTTAECYIDSLSITGPDAAHFKFYPNVTLPYAIYRQGDSVRIQANFLTNGSDGNRTFEATATVYTTLHDGSITSCDRSFALIGITRYVAPPDTVKLDLAPDSTEVADITDSTVGCKLIEIDNNTANPIRIDTLFMKSGAHLSARLYRTYPDTVTADGSTFAYICQLDSSQSSYDDTLVIVTEHALIANEYAIHWHAKALQAVSFAASTQALMLSANPNPSSGSMKFSFGGVHDATIQIMDLLGRVIAESRGVNSEFEWKGGAAKGVYIARVTGLNAQRQAVTLSSRVVIVR